MIEMSMEHLAKSGITPERGYTFIYRLLKDDCVIYVGQTKNIKSRVYQHNRDGKDFSLIQFYPCEMASSTKQERDEILRFNPKFNKDLPKTDKYITLGQARSIMSKGIASSISNRLNVIFTGTEDKKSNRIYVSASDVNKQTEILTELINKLHAKECK